MAAVQVAAHILLAVATAAAGTAAAGVTPAQGLRACPGASGTALYATCNSRTQLRELMQARLNRLNYNAKARCGHCLYPPSARDHLNWMKALMESKHLVFHLMQVLGVKMARRYFCTSNVRDLLRIHDPHIGTPRNYVLKRLEGASAKQVRRAPTYHARACALCAPCAPYTPCAPYAPHSTRAPLAGRIRAAVRCTWCTMGWSSCAASG